MNSRIKGMVIIAIIFVVISTYYYNQVIEQANILRPIEYKLNAMSEKIFVSNNEEEIIDLLE
jgi:uncharacterized protein (DUF2164 family)